MSILLEMRRNKESRIENLTEEISEKMFNEIESILKKYAGDELTDTVSNEVAEIVDSISKKVATSKADEEIGEAELEIGLSQHENRYI